MIRSEASYRSINSYIFFIPLLIFIHADSSKATEIIFESPEVSSEEINVPNRSNEKTPLFTACCSTPTVTSTSIKSWKYEDTKVAVFTFQGKRAYMEDRFYIDENFGDTGVSVYAIFDGHSTDFAAKYVVENLMKSLKEKIKDLKQGAQQTKFNKYMLKNGTIDYKMLLNDEILAVEKTLLETLRKRIDKAVLPTVNLLEDYDDFVENHVFNYDALLRSEDIDEEVKKEIRTSISGHDSGTTALIALTDNGKLFVANVGDSRGVMINNKKKIRELSEDHKPEKKKEKKRIEEAKGEVKCDEGSTIPRIDGLSLSRTIGDSRIKMLKHIIADPDTFEYNLNKFEPKFIMLASDGLWDQFSSKEALEYINDRLDKELFGAKDIVKEAYQRGSGDNITVLIVKTQ